MPRGAFIVFEGLDGSGQSTQVRLLSEYLSGQGREVLTTKEPTQNSEAGREIIAVLTHQKTLPPLALQELFAVDRRHHLESEILPALKRGAVVISDRYRWSTYAFGSIDCELEYLMQLNEGFLEPDLTLFLRVRPEVSLERIAKRGKPIELFEKKEKLEKVCLNYDKLAAMFPQTIVLDGEQPIDAIHAEIVKKVEAILI